LAVSSTVKARASTNRLVVYIITESTIQANWAWCSSRDCCSSCRSRCCWNCKDW